MSNHGGKRKGAGRPPTEPSRSVRIPESMLRAAHALQRIAKGKGTSMDLAEIALAVNGSRTDWGGIVWYDERKIASGELKSKAYKLEDAEDWEGAQALREQAEDFERRWRDVEMSR